MNIVALIVCYLIGSINFAYLVAKYKKINIQEIGSGNPGSSNVLRALGRNYAIVVLLGDLSNLASQFYRINYFLDHLDSQDYRNLDYIDSRIDNKLLVKYASK